MKNASQVAPHTVMHWHVEGMDCGSCVGKINKALTGMPGVSDVQVSMASQRLSLALDSHESTDADSITQLLTTLGYPAELISDTYRTTAHASTLRWYQTAKGKQVLTNTLLLGSAWLMSVLLSSVLGQWAFIAACLIGMAPIARKAVQLLRNGVPFTIEMLMTIAASGALFIGAAPEAALVVLLFSIGELLEGVAAERARQGIRALTQLLPETALLLTNGTTTQVAAASLQTGNEILIRAGDRIAADGEIINGSGHIDEAAITGESIPVRKQIGDAVFAGTINTDGQLTVRVTQTAQQNTIARIIEAVESAQASKAPTERFIERFSRYYMPAIVLLALSVAVLPPLLFAEDWSTWLYRALALLLIGCPCALVISVPASISSALANGAKQGLLVKGGAVLEQMAKTQWVAFDKTGTLTQGQPTVTDIIAANGQQETTVLTAAAGLEAHASHPLANAICNEASAHGLNVSPAEQLETKAGLGVTGVAQGMRLSIGSPRFAAAAVDLHGYQNHIDQLENQGKTVVVLFNQTQLLGLIAIRDEPREDAVETLRSLQEMGIGATMLTGDNPRTAAAIAAELGIDFKAGLLPQDKVSAVAALSAQHQVMMVGDGINDAPALATAHVGVAMGSGTDVALETADAALLHNKLTDVPAKIQLARATMRNIHQNIWIALGLKGVFLITSILGITGLWIAILADTGATVLVTLNALRLLRYRAEK